MMESWKHSIALVIMFSISLFAVPVEPASGKRIALILSEYIPDSVDIEQSIQSRLSDFEVSTFIVKDCSNAESIAYHSNSEEDIAAMIFWTECSNYLRSFIDNELAVPVVEITFSEGLGVTETPNRVTRINVPAVDPTVREAIERHTGAKLVTPFMGYCYSPQFVEPDQDKHLGPAGSCLSRPIDPFSSVNWTSAIAETAAAVLETSPDLEGSSSGIEANTPFGIIHEPWNGQQIFLPGESILDVDHWTIKDNIAKSVSPSDNLIQLLCPQCSGSGDICGNECPPACNGNCTIKDGKKCCRGDGMGVPLGLISR